MSIKQLDIEQPVSPKQGSFNADKFDSLMQGCYGICYKVLLWVFLIEGLVGTIGSTYLFIIDGFDTPFTDAVYGKGVVHLIQMFSQFSKLIVFKVGIAAIIYRCVNKQREFAMYLRVYMEFIFFLWIGFIIIMVFSREENNEIMPEALW
mmetsp:Transcript_5061/g.4258  ORF Transcript_5061/g.4258 Transcript_5061/m.4258 type:complete len:149 (+) Transcript_5061:52-498(+)